MNKSTFTTVLNNAIFKSMKLDFVSKSMMLTRRVLYLLLRSRLLQVFLFNSEVFAVCVSESRVEEHSLSWNFTEFISMFSS